MILCRDFETMSAVNLKSSGATVYAQHPSTDVFCLSVKCDDEAPVLWVNPRFAAKLPTGHGLPLINISSLKHLYTEARLSTAHNDPFELAIDESIMEPRFGVPSIPLSMRACTAAQAATNALPRQLSKLGEALGCSGAGEGKDMGGHELMLKMCKPLPMYARDWERLDEKFGNFGFLQRARDVYKNASSKGKSAAYSQYIADWWVWLQALNIDPHSLLRWHHDTDKGPQDLVRLCQYCMQDTEEEHRVSNLMPQMNASETRMWRLGEVINHRGVHVDVDGARAAVAMVNEYKSHMASKLTDITNGYVQTAGQLGLIKSYCGASGIILPNTAKDTLEYSLKQPDLPLDVRKMLEVRVACGQTSVTKYEAMLRAAQLLNHRVSGVFMYCGAGTGRFSATLVQLHNMPRGTVKLKTDEAIEAAYRAMACGWREVELMYGDVMSLAASAIRGCIVAPPGYDFIASDFSSIEARVLAWLADEAAALAVFLTGQDPYILAARGIFGVGYDEITDKQRLVGKVCVLSLGFGGGIGAFASMARNYGIDLETLPPLVLPGARGSEYKKGEAIATTYLENLEKRIKLKVEKGIGKASFLDRMSLNAAIACDVIKQRWRVDRPGAVQFWADIETAAFAALRSPGNAFMAGGHVRLAVDGDYMLMRLPSGRCLRYFKPEIRVRQKFGKKAATITYMRMVEGKWQRTDTYGGKLCENAVQAVANDLLRHGMFNAEAHGYPIVLHVHDEAVSERKVGEGSQEEFNQKLIEAPDWADGIPMAAAGWRGRRYRKD